MGYHQLTEKQRHRIEVLLSQGKSKSAIAKDLGTHRSTIGREIERNSIKVLNHQVPVYDANPAQALTEHRRIDACEARYKVRGRVRSYVLEGLDNRWSPEQIAGRLALEKGKEILSYSSIYRFIEKEDRDAYVQLRDRLRRARCKRRRRPKKRRPTTRKGAPKKSIRERPLPCDQRTEIGHFERDLMEGLGRKTAVLVVADRKSRRVILRRVQKTSKAVQRETVRVLKSHKMRRCRKSMTNDNGPEFIQSISKEAEKELGVPVYFCDPCSPWQRGTVENIIGLIREYLPKKTDLSLISPRELSRIETLLNNRPRKVLNFRTPSEIFFRQKRI